MKPMDQLPVAIAQKKTTIYSGAVEPKVKISLRALLEDDVPLIWQWLHEFPKQNLDDYAPKTLEAFKLDIQKRLAQGEIIGIILRGGEPVGVIGFRQLTDYLGALHGICFTSKVHRTGLTQYAVHKFLKMMFRETKLDKISATYFRDNEQIKGFLKKQGFEHEGTMKMHTRRAGRPIDVSLVALYRHKVKLAEVN